MELSKRAKWLVRKLLAGDCPAASAKVVAELDAAGLYVQRERPRGEGIICTIHERQCLRPGGREGDVRRASKSEFRKRAIELGIIKAGGEHG